MPRFAANLTMMFNEYPFLDRFAAARDAGFEAVEFLFPYDYQPDEIGQRLVDNNLTQALFNAPPGDWEAGDRGMACVRSRREAFVAGLQALLPYAEATRVTQIHVMCGIGEPSDTEQRACYVDNIRTAADILGAEGLKVLIEPINRRDIPGMFLHDFDLAAQLLDEIDRTNVALQFDVYHRQIIHGDIVTGLRDLIGVTAHIQIADVPERHEPGTGEINYRRVFSEIDALGYDGWIGCEYRPHDGTVAGLGWLAGLTGD